MVSRALLAILAAGVAATLVSGGAARQQAAAGPVTFVVTGHGWGHGVGMAQYGAFGYARKGWSARKILVHYYPGTSLTTTSVKQIRVLLADGVASVTVSSPTAFRVRAGDGSSYKLAAGSYPLGPALKVRLKPNTAAKALPGPIVFVPGSRPLTAGHPYRGSIQVAAKRGSLQVVDLVALDDYVRGVVPEEVSSDWPAAALQAQAVASRSYAVAVRGGGAYDVYDDTRSQVYGGIDAERPSSNAAVAATAGKVLTYHGRPAVTYFFASSGGKTAAIQDVFSGSGPVPYLVSVKDPYDTLSPYHSWGPFVYSSSGLKKRLGLSSKPLDSRLVRNPSSRVDSVALTTAAGSRALSGSDVRRLLGLRSTWFSIGVLSLAKPARSFVYGLKGQLTGLAHGVRNARIQRRTTGGVWKLVTKVGRVEKGAFTAPFVAKSPGLYRLAAAKAVTQPIKVSVAASVKLESATGALSGSARPVFAGSPVSIQRFDGSNWSQVAAARLGSDGRFAATLTTTAGSYRARIAPGHGFLPGVSPVLRVSAQ